MGYIYIIKNDVNDNVYIGQTTRNIEIRWKEHLRHSHLAKNQILGKAFQKYGKEHFYIEELEECDNSLLNKREKYWIEFYNSFEKGYNATAGGQDNFIMTDKISEVLELWSQGKLVCEIVEITKLNVETVRNYLNQQGISHDLIRERANQAISKSRSKSVLQFDLQNNFVQEWPSAKLAGEGLQINSRNISSVCLGKRKTAGGYKWKYKGD